MDGTIRKRQRGGGNIKAIIAIGLLVFFVYASFKIIPAFASNYQLKDHMDITARYAAVSPQTATDVREAVWKKIEELEIPAKPEALKVNKGNRRVQISVQYTVEVTLLGYPVKLNFHPEVDNRGY